VERRRISMELHDSIGQSLSLIKLQLQNALKAGENGKAISMHNLQAISTLVSDTISDLRKISANLRPIILDDLGLLPSIEWYLRDFGKKTGLAVKIDLTAKDVRLNEGAEAHVFRIIQEIMMNIFKHSNAHQIRFKNSLQNGKALFEIREDGQGFVGQNIFAAANRRKGMGLINIMERVNIVRGSLNITSPPSGGTCFVVSVPVNK